MILAGDVGGTKTQLAFFETAGERVRPVKEARYKSQEHDSLEEIVQRFLHEHRMSAESACFGVAGPVQHGVAEITNLTWTVDADRLARTVGLTSVNVINDLEATAYSIDVLDESDFVTLQAGATRAVGNRAVIAAGTGLGEAGLYWDGHRHRPFASEGGHSDFAPRTGADFDLLTDIREKFGHSAWERALSGPGLLNIYESLSKRSSMTESSELLEQISAGGPAVISQAALEKRSELCVAALEMFVSLYGAEAGNLALKVLATGGVFVAGGIAPRIRPAMEDGTFIAAFNDKGRLSSMMRNIPVRMIVNEKAPLIGAANRAAIGVQ